MYQYMIHPKAKRLGVVQSAPLMSQLMLSLRHALIFKTTRIARPRLSDTLHVSLIIYSAKNGKAST
jgi:hypothetical protein